VTSEIATTARPFDGMADIMRRGALRLALFPSFFYRKDETSGELRGVGIEIARAFAQSLGVALAPQEHPSPPAVVEALASAAADIALLGIDPARAGAVDFAPPLFAADFTYLVPGDSPVRAVAEADRRAIRIAVVRHHAMDTVLRSQLKAASPVYADTPDAAFDLLRAGQADVLAGIRPGLLTYADALPGARVLAGRYGRNVIALAVKRGEPRWLATVIEFAGTAKMDGTVTRAIASAGLRGVDATVG
jgi:polar amino acid transport system substrate-binding protein